jgi:hypothetical protein
MLKPLCKMLIWARVEQLHHLSMLCMKWKPRGGPSTDLHVNSELSKQRVKTKMVDGEVCSKILTGQE